MGLVANLLIDVLLEANAEQLREVALWAAHGRLKIPLRNIHERATLSVLGADISEREARQPSGEASAVVARLDVVSTVKHHA